MVRWRAGGTAEGNTIELGVRFAINAEDQESVTYAHAKQCQESRPGNSMFDPRSHNRNISILFHTREHIQSFLCDMDQASRPAHIYSLPQ